VGRPAPRLRRPDPVEEAAAIAAKAASDAREAELREAKQQQRRVGDA
jgi:hypothetical protein